MKHRKILLQQKAIPTGKQGWLFVMKLLFIHLFFAIGYGSFHCMKAVDIDIVDKQIHFQRFDFSQIQNSKQASNGFGLRITKVCFF